MGKIFDKLSNAIAGLKKQHPAIGASLQGITTNIDTLETQIRQMQAQNPAIQADLQSASSTIQELKTQAEALVAALQAGVSKPATVGAPPAAPSAPSTTSEEGS